MLLELDVEGYLINQTNKKGGLCLKWANSGTKGVPDRIVIHEGKSYFVELKKPKGTRSPHQIRMARLFLDRGMTIHLIHSKEEADWFVHTYLT